MQSDTVTPSPSTNSVLARQIKALWLSGLNTAEIASRTGAKHHDVHNLHCKLMNEKHEVGNDKS